MTNLRILATIMVVGLFSQYCVATIRVQPTALHSFGGGADGGTPAAGLIQASDGNFYGTTSRGGANDTGTVFQITAAGTLTSLYSFTGGADGGDPEAGLVQGSDSNFYGTTLHGGVSDTGTVFQVTSAGTFTTLYSFTGGVDGALPLAGLAQGSDGNFYGTTSRGGTSDTGTVFQITSVGTLTTVHSFTGLGVDGATPEGGLIQGPDGFFYGTTVVGGTNNDGTVFQISSNGVSTTIYQFSKNRIDGENPQATLVQGSDGLFYGTTRRGGTRNEGTAFKISSAGTLSTVFHFGGVAGEGPRAALIQAADGFFYGMTTFGGFNFGSVFQMMSNGVLKTLYNFGGGTDGGVPYGGLVRGTDGYFYGTTGFGGPNLHGVVFRLSAFPSGTYSGLAVQTNAPSSASSGYLSLTMKLVGSFTAKLTMGGVPSSFQGQFDVSGNATNTVSLKNSNPLQVILHLNEGGGSNQITGTVSNSVFTSEVLANLAVYSKTNAFPGAGRYTFNLAPANTNDTAVPQGYGYGTLTVSKLGSARLSGVLGDGTKISASGSLSAFNTFPLYNALYQRKQGSSTGWITVVPSNTVTATIDWFKPATPKDRLYPVGFATAAALDGALYVPPSKGGPTVAGNWQLTAGGGNLLSNFVKSVVIDSNGFVTVSSPGSDGLLLAMQPTTGQFSGSFVTPAIAKRVTLNGLLLQNTNSGAGFFVGTNQTGFAILQLGP